MNRAGPPFSLRVPLRVTLRMFTHFAGLLGLPAMRTCTLSPRTRNESPLGVSPTWDEEHVAGFPQLGPAVPWTAVENPLAS